MKKSSTKIIAVADAEYEIIRVPKSRYLQAQVFGSKDCVALSTMMRLFPEFRIEVIED